MLSCVTFHAESPLPVCVVAGGGRTPRPAIHLPVFGALFVGLLHEREGEDAELAIGRHCSKSKHRYLESLICDPDLKAYLVGRGLLLRTPSVFPLLRV